MRWVQRAEPGEQFGLLRHSDRGTVTAEFAVVMPAVLMVLVLVIGGIVLTTNRLTLASAAADVARLEARGDDAQAQQRLEQAGSSISVDRERRGALLCITLRAGPQRGPLSALSANGNACAAVIEQTGNQ